MVKKQQTKHKITSKYYNLILIFGIIVAASLFVFSPAHFSVLGISAIFFCSYSLYTKTLYQNNKQLKAHFIVFGVLLAAIIGLIFAQIKNTTGGCVSITGHVPCFSYSDMTYIYMELIGSILVIGALSILNISYRRRLKKNKR
ncbi:MAG: hypothetical protein WAQ27_03155 [Candidatus Microsaccharimonas sp.]